jgi:hypothetical protein
MSVEFDPAWEYHVPDPEIAECVYARQPPRRLSSLLDRRDADVPPGLSVVPHPDGCRSRLAREKPQPREARRLGLLDCRHCRRVFRPGWHGQRFCGLSCARKAGASGRRKEPVAARECERCGAAFTPSNPSRAVQRFCSRSCARRKGAT